MAMKPLRPCQHPGCGELVPGGYCTRHKPKERPRSEEAESWRRMYRTKTWLEDLRPTQLLLEPFCRECAKQGRRTPATDVDHVEDHKGDWEKFCDRTNLQSLCHRCHSRKTAAELWENRTKTKQRKSR